MASASLAEVATQMNGDIPACRSRLMIDGTAPGWESYEETVAEYPPQELEEQPRGATMLYSSGTTGRPKGILRPLRGDRVSERVPEADAVIEGLFRIGPESI